MTTFFKILMIVFVAILIGGMLYGVVTTTSSGSDQSSRIQRSGDGFSQPDREKFNGGLQFPVDIFKNAVIITIVCVAYLNTAKLVGKKV